MRAYVLIHHMACIQKLMADSLSLVNVTGIMTMSGFNWSSSAPCSGQKPHLLACSETADSLSRLCREQKVKTQVISRNFAFLAAVLAPGKLHWTISPLKYPGGQNKVLTPALAMGIESWVRLSIILPLSSTTLLIHPKKASSPTEKMSSSLHGKLSCSSPQDHEPRSGFSCLSPLQCYFGPWWQDSVHCTHAQNCSHVQLPL